MRSQRWPKTRGWEEQGSSVIWKSSKLVWNTVRRLLEINVTSVQPAVKLYNQYWIKCCFFNSHRLLTFSWELKLSNSILKCTEALVQTFTVMSKVVRGFFYALHCLSRALTSRLCVFACVCVCVCFYSVCVCATECTIDFLDNLLPWYSNKQVWLCLFCKIQEFLKSVQEVRDPCGKTEVQYHNIWV